MKRRYLAERADLEAAFGELAEAAHQIRHTREALRGEQASAIQLGYNQAEFNF